jgi:CheY-like chemotaxis protein
VLDFIVLYVEDDEGDRFFMEYAFSAAGLSTALRMVPDGRTAIQYLSGMGPFADRSLFPIPSVILIDLNLPEISGFDVLVWLRKHPDYASLPAIIFSSSSHPEDPIKARGFGANDFWRKPANSLHFSRVVDAIRQKWLPPVPPSPPSSRSVQP